MVLHFVCGLPRLNLIHVSSLFKGTHEDSQDLPSADVNGEECWERVSVKVEVKE
jgi:hypothetical protein